MVCLYFTHKTDLGPAESYSISMSNFEEWLDNYAAANVGVVGYYEYRTLAQDTYHTGVSDLIVDDSKSISFALDNVGGRSRMFVAAPFADLILNADGNAVPYVATDDGIIMEVEAGEYQIYSTSAYSGELIDRAMSPLYAAISIVVRLAVIVAVLAAVGRLAEGINVLLLFPFYRKYFRMLRDRVFKCSTYSPRYAIE